MTDTDIFSLTITLTIVTHNDISHFELECALAV